jgi:hypothetical protein
MTDGIKVFMGQHNRFFITSLESLIFGARFPCIVSYIGKRRKDVISCRFFSKATGRIKDLKLKSLVG